MQQSMEETSKLAVPKQTRVPAEVVTPPTSACRTSLALLGDGSFVGIVSCSCKCSHKKHGGKKAYYA